MTGGKVRDVSDTARWVAFFRALESERPDALFCDPHARRLAGDRGRTIAEALPQGPLRWSLAVRTRVFDELVLGAVRDEGVRVVLNLAAGLDVRPYRLALPSELRWIEVDLPDIVEQKNDALKDERPVCHVERIALDLSDPVARRNLFVRMPKGRVLAVTEGLLAYLDERRVAALADDLRCSLPGSLWALENVSPAILARMRRTWGKALGPANAAMQFAPAEGLAFFRRYGWEPRSVRSLLDEAQRLGREMPFVSFVRTLSSFVRPLERAYAKRQASFRDAVVYALMEPSS